MQTMERDMLAMSEKLDMVLSALTEAKGGWRAMMWIAGAVASAAAAVTWALQHVTLKA
jgi:negative regulator of sigma E activity